MFGMKKLKWVISRKDQECKKFRGYNKRGHPEYDKHWVSLCCVASS